MQRFSLLFPAGAFAAGAFAAGAFATAEPLQQLEKLAAVAVYFFVSKTGYVTKCIESGRLGQAKRFQGGIMKHDESRCATHSSFRAAPFANILAELCILCR